MGFWSKLFGRRDPGLHCGKCGKALQRDVPAARRGAMGDPFAEAVHRVAGVLATPGYMCVKCGTVVCKGCLPMDGTRICPKCGSTETRHFSEGGIG